MAIIGFLGGGNMAEAVLRKNWSDVRKTQNIPAVFEKLVLWKLNIWNLEFEVSVGLIDFCQYFLISAGFIIISDDLQSFQILDSQTQKIRSMFLILGLFMLRSWTANCWRRARFSRTMPCLLLNMSLRNSKMNLARIFKVASFQIFL